MAHGHIAVVAAEKDLGTLGDDLALAVDAGVDGGLSAAGADGLDLGKGVGQLHKALGTGEEMGQKVRAQTKAEHRQILFIHQRAKLVYLQGSEKLRLIGDYNIMLSGKGVLGADVLIGSDDAGLALKPDAAADDLRPVAGVGAGLYEPDF